MIPPSGKGSEALDFHRSYAVGRQTSLVITLIQIYMYDHNNV